MNKIDSTDNDTFKKLHSLTTAKGLKKEGLFLLSGENLIREFLHTLSNGAAPPGPNLAIRHQLLTLRINPLPQIPEHKTIQLAPNLFDALDSVGTGFNILVLEQPPMPMLDIAALKTHQPDGIELVVPIGDPGNLGAVLRSAEAFGVTRAILTEEAAHPFLPKAVKASAGSVMRLPMVRGPALRQFPSSCIALDMKGEPIDRFIWPRDGMLVVGEEGRGLGDAHFKTTISIPTQGVESLNAVVAASIALAMRQFKS